MQSNNPNNYHWTETDISQFCESQLTAILNGKGYTISNLDVSMQITNRMNRMGFLWDISMTIEKNGLVKKIKEYDIYTENVDDEINEIMKIIKEEARQKYGMQKELKKSNGYEFNRNVMIQLENNNNDNISDTRVNITNSKKEEIQDTKKINLKFLIKAKTEDDFLNFFFKYDYFSQYAPFSSKKTVKLTEKILFENLNRKEKKFKMKMDDCVTDNSIVTFLVKQTENNDLNLEIIQDGILREESVKGFWREFIIPKIRMFFNISIFEK